MHSNLYSTLYRTPWFQRALDLIAPCRCSLCGLPSGRALELCLACEGELPWLTHCCRQCGLPLPGTGSLCGRCLAKPPGFDACIAACAYTEPVSGWVHAGKYHGDFPSLRLLAYLLRRALSDRDIPEQLPDLVLPMPLHWRRRWQRGFNQARELSDELLRHPDFSALTIDALLAGRIRATATQRELGVAERQRNLLGAFRVRRPLFGESVAIVDDVLTTGASAHTLALALKAAGAGHVQVWCCARTPAA
ncbi:MAG: double zinc ribbon domain-containing protein [Halieaceae bacterium]|jgi:ComF family protein|nr:double zinc ribbon domain-containing protein [Halieaceae bacterium]